MQALETQSMVASFPKVFPPEGVCKGYVLGKHHQTPFEFGRVWRVEKLLELVHSGVCCINLPSLEGPRCILNFIDHLSRFTWVVFMKNKNVVFEKFKDFQSFYEN